MAMQARLYLCDNIEEECTKLGKIHTANGLRALYVKLDMLPAQADPCYRLACSRVSECQ